MLVVVSSLGAGDSELMFVFVINLRLCVDSDFERFKFFFEDFFDLFSVLTVSFAVVEEASGTTVYQ